MRFQIKGFDDPNFLKLGMFLLLSGLITYLMSFVFDFSGLIGLRAGGGLGLFICVAYLVARLRKR